MMKRLLIFGAGGHGRELAWMANRAYGKKVRVEFVVDQQRFCRPSIDGRRVHLFESLQACADSRFIVALGDPLARQRGADIMKSKFAPIAFRDPSVICSDTVEFAGGAVAMAGTIITTNVVIGGHSHLNIGCRVSHDVKIGSFVTLSPGVQVSGNVVIEDGVFLGANATVINGTSIEPLTIGKHSVVAAGACVIGRVIHGVMVAGVPAVEKKR